MYIYIYVCVCVSFVALPFIQHRVGTPSRIRGCWVWLWVSETASVFNRACWFQRLRQVFERCRLFSFINTYHLKCQLCVNRDSCSILRSIFSDDSNSLLLKTNFSKLTSMIEFSFLPMITYDYSTWFLVQNTSFLEILPFRFICGEMTLGWQGS